MIQIDEYKKIDLFFTAKIEALEELMGKTRSLWDEAQNKLYDQCVKERGPHPHDDIICPYCGYNWIPF